MKKNAANKKPEIASKGTLTSYVRSDLEKEKDIQPNLLTKVITNIKTSRNNPENIIPPKSSLSFSFVLNLLLDLFGIVKTAINVENKLNIAIIRNINCHPSKLSILPPSIGPPTAPSPTTVMCRPNAFPECSIGEDILRKR